MLKTVSLSTDSKKLNKFHSKVGAKESDTMNIITEDMITAGAPAIKFSNPGNTIVHVGPEAITNYKDLKFKMMSCIKQGCIKYE